MVASAERRSAAGASAGGAATGACSAEYLAPEVVRQAAMVLLTGTAAAKQEETLEEATLEVPKEAAQQAGAPAHATPTVTAAATSAGDQTITPGSTAPALTTDDSQGLLAVTGMDHVIAVLEKIEDGLLDVGDVLLPHLGLVHRQLHVPVDAPLHRGGIERLAVAEGDVRTQLQRPLGEVLVRLQRLGQFGQNGGRCVHAAEMLLKADEIDSRPFGGGDGDVPGLYSVRLGQRLCHAGETEEPDAQHGGVHPTQILRHHNLQFLGPLMCRAMQHGAAGVLSKPLQIEDLLGRLAYACAEQAE